MLFLQINFDIAFFFVCSFFSVHGDSRVDTAEASPNESQDRRYRSDAGFDGKQIKMNQIYKNEMPTLALNEIITDSLFLIFPEPEKNVQKRKIASVQTRSQKRRAVEQTAAAADDAHRPEPQNPEGVEEDSDLETSTDSDNDGDDVAVEVGPLVCACCDKKRRISTTTVTARFLDAHHKRLPVLCPVVGSSCSDAEDDTVCHAVSPALIAILRSDDDPPADAELHTDWERSFFNMADRRKGLRGTMAVFNKLVDVLRRHHYVYPRNFLSWDSDVQHDWALYIQSSPAAQNRMLRSMKTDHKMMPFCSADAVTRSQCLLKLPENDQGRLQRLWSFSSTVVEDNLEEREWRVEVGPYSWWTGCVVVKVEGVSGSDVNAVLSGNVTSDPHRPVQITVRKSWSKVDITVEHHKLWIQPWQLPAEPIPLPAQMHADDPLPAFWELTKILEPHSTPDHPRIGKAWKPSRGELETAPVQSWLRVVYTKHGATAPGVVCVYTPRPEQVTNRCVRVVRHFFWRAADDSWSTMPVDEDDWADKFHYDQCYFETIAESQTQKEVHKQHEAPASVRRSGRVKTSFNVTDAPPQHCVRRLWSWYRLEQAGAHLCSPHPDAGRFDLAEVTVIRILESFQKRRRQLEETAQRRILEPLYGRENDAAAASDPLVSFPPPPVLPLRRFPSAEDDVGSWPCVSCRATFPTETELRQHLAQYHGGAARVCRAIEHQYASNPEMITPPSIIRGTIRAATEEREGWQWQTCVCCAGCFLNVEKECVMTTWRKLTQDSEEVEDELCDILDPAVYAARYQHPESDVKNASVPVWDPAANDVRLVLLHKRRVSMRLQQRNVPHGGVEWCSVLSEDDNMLLCRQCHADLSRQEVPARGLVNGFFPSRDHFRGSSFATRMLLRKYFGVAHRVAFGLGKRPFFVPPTEELPPGARHGATANTVYFPTAAVSLRQEGNDGAPECQRHIALVFEQHVVDKDVIDSKVLDLDVAEYTALSTFTKRCNRMYKDHTFNEPEMYVSERGAVSKMPRALWGCRAFADETVGAADPARQPMPGGARGGDTTTAILPNGFSSALSHSVDEDGLLHEVLENVKPLVQVLEEEVFSPAAAVPAARVTSQFTNENPVDQFSADSWLQCMPELFSMGAGGPEYRHRDTFRSGNLSYRAQAAVFLRMEEPQYGEPLHGDADADVFKSYPIWFASPEDAAQTDAYTAHEGIGRFGTHSEYLAVAWDVYTRMLVVDGARAYFRTDKGISGVKQMANLLEGDQLSWALEFARDCRSFNEVFRSDRVPEQAKKLLKAISFSTRCVRGTLACKEKARCVTHWFTNLFGALSQFCTSNPQWERDYSFANLAHAAVSGRTVFGAGLSTGEMPPVLPLSTMYQVVAGNPVVHAVAFNAESERLHRAVFRVGKPVPGVLGCSRAHAASHEETGKGNLHEHLMVYGVELHHLLRLQSCIGRVHQEARERLVTQPSEVDRSETITAAAKTILTLIRDHEQWCIKRTSSVQHDAIAPDLHDSHQSSFATDRDFVMSFTEKEKARIGFWQPRLLLKTRLVDAVVHQAFATTSAGNIALAEDIQALDVFVATSRSYLPPDVGLPGSIVFKYCDRLVSPQWTPRDLARQIMQDRLANPKQNLVIELKRSMSDGSRIVQSSDHRFPLMKIKPDVALRDRVSGFTNVQPVELPERRRSILSHRSARHPEESYLVGHVSAAPKLPLRPRCLGAASPTHSSAWNPLIVDQTDGQIIIDQPTIIDEISTATTAPPNAFQGRIRDGDHAGRHVEIDFAQFTGKYQARRRAGHEHPCGPSGGTFEDFVQHFSDTATATERWEGGKMVERCLGAICPAYRTAGSDMDAATWRRNFLWHVTALANDVLKHMCSSACLSPSAQKQVNDVAGYINACRFGYHYDISLGEFLASVFELIRLAGKELILRPRVIKDARSNRQGRVVQERNHPFQNGSNRAVLATLTVNFDMQDCSMCVVVPDELKTNPGVLAAWKDVLVEVAVDVRTPLLLKDFCPDMVCQIAKPAPGRRMQFAGLTEKGDARLMDVDKAWGGGRGGRGGRDVEEVWTARDLVANPASRCKAPRCFHDLLDELRNRVGARMVREEIEQCTLDWMAHGQVNTASNGRQFTVHPHRYKNKQGRKQIAVVLQAGDPATEAAPSSSSSASASASPPPPPSAACDYNEAFLNLLTRCSQQAVDRVFRASHDTSYYCTAYKGRIINIFMYKLRILKASVIGT